MEPEEAVLEMTDYRVALILPDSRNVLAARDVAGYQLPSVSIKQWARPTQQLQKEIRDTWRLHVLILDLLPGFPACAVAEVLIPGDPAGLESIALKQLADSALSVEQRARLASILIGESTPEDRFSQVGWIDEAIRWVQAQTGKRLSSKGDIEQFSAARNFTLLRFQMDDAQRYWLKATGAPNAHELSVTSVLSRLAGKYLPRIISSDFAWNAWIAAEEATRMPETILSPFHLFTVLEIAVESMAQLQIRTAGRSRELLAAGVFDQRMPVYHSRVADLFDYVDEAMSHQTSTKVPRLDRRRTREIRRILEKTCHRMDSIGIPETVVHGDINPGNVLPAGDHCKFIDWSEAYLGNPLITLQRLLLLNRTEDLETRDSMNLSLKRLYQGVWASNYGSTPINEGFVYMPILAIASALLGRSDWSTAPQREDLRRQSYARCLARHMDRAARDPSLLEALCH